MHHKESLTYAKYKIKKKKQEQQRLEVQRQQDVVTKQKTKEDKVFVGNWAETTKVQEPVVIQTESKSTMSLRDIQEQELRQQQEQRNREAVESSRQQTVTKGAPKWGGVWGGAQPVPVAQQQKLSLREIQELELKGKPAIEIVNKPEEPFISVNWGKPHILPPQTIQEQDPPKQTKEPKQQNNNKKNKQVEQIQEQEKEEPKKETQQKKQNSPKKQPQPPQQQQQQEPEPQKKSEQKKGTEKQHQKKQAQPQPSKKDQSVVWSATTTQPKSLREIQEDELHTTVTQPNNNNRNPQPQQVDKDSDLFWDYEEKSAAVQTTQKPTDEFPSLTSGTKKKNNATEVAYKPVVAKAEPKDQDFVNWSKKQLKNLTRNDETTLTEYLLSLHSDKEVKEYVKEVLGTADNANKFADEFIKRKKAQKSNITNHNNVPQQQQQKQPKQTPAQQPQQAQSSLAQQQQQKKKKKMQKLPAELLGFTTTTLPGEIETLED